MFRDDDLDAIFTVFEEAGDSLIRSGCHVSDEKKDDFRIVGTLLELDPKYFEELTGFPLYEQKEFNFD